MGKLFFVALVFFYSVFVFVVVGENENNAESSQDAQVDSAGTSPEFELPRWFDDDETNRVFVDSVDRVNRRYWERYGLVNLALELDYEKPLRWFKVTKASLKEKKTLSEGVKYNFEYTCYNPYTTHSGTVDALNELGKEKAEKLYTEYRIKIGNYKVPSEHLPPTFKKKMLSGMLMAVDPTLLSNMKRLPASTPEEHYLSVIQMPTPEKEEDAISEPKRPEPIIRSHRITKRLEPAPEDVVTDEGFVPPESDVNIWMDTDHDGIPDRRATPEEIRELQKKEREAMEREAEREPDHLEL